MRLATVVRTVFGTTFLFVTLFGSASLLSADVDDRFTEWSAPENLGPPVNTVAGEQAAFISKDGLSLYFTSNRPGGLGGTDIWVSHRMSHDHPWAIPENLGPNVNSAANEFAPSLTIDGHTMFFHSDRLGGAGDFDIYVAQRRDTRDDFAWEEAQPLPGDVNTAANEEHPAYFEDETTGVITLYFTSRRRLEGACGDDIYVSTLRPDGTFGPGELVAELSTCDEGSNLDFERQPAIRRDGLEMYLSSNRPGTFGGLDLWVSTRASTSEPWSTPVNLGDGINTASVDARPALSFDGTELYFQSNRLGGALDLFVMRRTKPQNE